MNVQVGKVYSLADDNGNPKPGIIPRYVSYADDTVTYFMVMPDSGDYEVIGPAQCSRKAFKQWAEVEIPVNDNVRRQMDDYKQRVDKSNKNLSRIIAEAVIENAADENLIQELIKRGYAVSRPK